MRPEARKKLGFYPTPDRVVKAIARMLVPKGTTSIVDAGAGKGDALMLLRDEIHKQHENFPVKLYGTELDKNRAAECDEKFQRTGGYCLWSGIEETGSINKASVLWLNPPYDTVAGEGRMEQILLEFCESWVGRDGLMIAILPKQALMDEEQWPTELARHIDSKFTIDCYRFPNPEYEVFKQFVLFCVKNKNERYRSWGKLDWFNVKNVLWDNCKTRYELKPHAAFDLKRDKVGLDVMKYAIERSGYGGFLLNEASAHITKIEQPLLPLKEGHLALALAGGLCDGVVESTAGRFLLKGSLSSEFLKKSERVKTDNDGDPTHTIATFRTTYKMLVRCLLEDGSIENYNSHEDEISEAELNKDEEEEGDEECQAKDTKTARRLRRVQRRQDYPAAPTASHL